MSLTSASVVDCDMDSVDHKAKFIIWLSSLRASVVLTSSCCPPPSAFRTCVRIAERTGERSGRPVALIAAPSSPAAAPPTPPFPAGSGGLGALMAETGSGRLSGGGAVLCALNWWLGERSAFCTFIGGVVSAALGGALGATPPLSSTMSAASGTLTLGGNGDTAVFLETDEGDAWPHGEADDVQHLDVEESPYHWVDGRLERRRRPRQIGVPRWYMEELRAQRRDHRRHGF